MLVHTAVGLLDRSELRIEDVVNETEDARKIETKFWRGAELVRQDVTVSIWRGLDLSADQGAMNG